MEYQIRCLKTSGILEPATFRIIGTNNSYSINSSPGCLYRFRFEYNKTDEGELVVFNGDITFIKNVDCVHNPYESFRIGLLEEFYDLFKDRVQYGAYNSQIVLQIQDERIYQRCENDGLETAILKATIVEIENRLNELAFGASATKPLFK